ncbi:MAG: TMEM175 family protein [Candidatus Dormibacteraeota bacterium]|nr:TMEM175 family protein [Candidatus Dormibacteraeota bacterium]
MRSKARLEAFSDGIFAIAATLLVLDLGVPKTGSSLLEGLLHQWPAYAAYATSFLTIGIIWVNHHAVLERLERVDRGLLFLNLILLLFVALIPFPTKVLAQYLQSGGADAHVAAAAYGVAMILMGLSFSILNYYATARGLMAGQQRLTFMQQVRFSIGLVMYAVGTGVALIDARIALLIYAALAVYYVIEPLMAATLDGDATPRIDSFR